VRGALLIYESRLHILDEQSIGHSFRIIDFKRKMLPGKIVVLEIIVDEMRGSFFSRIHANSFSTLSKLLFP